LPLSEVLDWNDTIVGPATAPGDGCRAILRWSGPALARWLNAVIRSRHVPRSTDTSRGSVVSDTREGVAFASLPESANRRSTVERCDVGIDAWNLTIEADLYRWPQGRSATGQEMVELHLPNSAPLIEELIRSAAMHGIRLARPGEFTLRSFLAGRLDLAQAEGVLGLVSARDPATLMAAIDRRTGGLSRPISDLRCDLLNLLADIDANLDFAHEDIEFLADDRLRERLDDLRTRLERIRRDLLGRGLAGEVPQVVLAGPPNAGKSTLFNALVGAEAAIASPVAGSTRDIVSARVRWFGRDLELMDTAGLGFAEGRLGFSSGTESPGAGLPANGGREPGEVWAESIAAGVRQVRASAIASASLVLECHPVDAPRAASDGSDDPAPGPNSDPATLRFPTERSADSAEPTVPILRLATRADEAQAGLDSWDDVVDGWPLGIDFLVGRFSGTLMAKPQAPRGPTSLEVSVRPIHETPDPLGHRRALGETEPLTEKKGQRGEADHLHLGAELPGPADPLEPLRRRIVEELQRPGAGAAQLVGTDRCLEALTRADAALVSAAELVAADAGQELVASLLREALADLGTIIGAVHTDDLLDRIFSRFCIGK
jgi:tRNA U34 5-carboxymethylaminomethyl modifying GTPase MnmE/TrmE